jgi:3-hydroxyisobutyrate dehydrogenase-like beta-hydroxyacid dehydrogenase
MNGTVTLIGFGEAGSTFANAGGWGRAAQVYDIKDKAVHIAESGVTGCAGAAQALAGSALVLSLVTADQVLIAAREVASKIAAGALYLDMNSVAPATKREAAQAIHAAGGRYVDVAVMAPVHPAKLAVPLLACGPHAETGAAALGQLGFTSVRCVGAEIGRASAIKMIRSVMVKGIEALTAEMIIAAEVAGVKDEVLASLDASERTMSWADRANYNLDRMLIHGHRRAAEMYESSETLRGLGVSPMMTENTVNWQQGLGDLALASVPDALEAKLAAILNSPAFKGEV